MALTLVLVRHGKAEPPARELPDASRELTAAGRASLRESLSKAAALLGDVASDDLAVWTSPARRVQQTAEEAVDILGRGTPQAQDFLLEQTDENLTAFLRALDAQVAAHPSGVLVCACHAPFVDRAAKRLTGIDFGGLRLKFGYGACCGIALPEAPVDRAASHVPTGSLRWFVQGL